MYKKMKRGTSVHKTLIQYGHPALIIGTMMIVFTGKENTLWFSCNDIPNF